MDYDTFNEMVDSEEPKPKAVSREGDIFGSPPPPDLLEFLRQCNGGWLDGRCVAFDVYPDYILGIRDDDLALSMQHALAKYADRLHPGMLPIATTHEDDVLVLWSQPNGAHEVWLLERDSAFGPRRIASSFGEFFEALEPSEETRVDEFYQNGRNAYTAGDYGRAYELFMQAWVLRPSAINAFWRSEALAGLGRHEEASEWLDRAFSLSPRNPKIAMAVAERSVQEGKLEKAHRILEEQLTQNPEYGPARKLLAKLSEGDNAPA